VLVSLAATDVATGIVGIAGFGIPAIDICVLGQGWLLPGTTESEEILRPDCACALVTRHTNVRNPNAPGARIGTAMLAIFDLGTSGVTAVPSE